jgi:hypothetical protein
MLLFRVNDCFGRRGDHRNIGSNKFSPYLSAIRNPRVRCQWFMEGFCPASESFLSSSTSGAQQRHAMISIRN